MKMWSHDPRAKRSCRHSHNSDVLQKPQEYYTIMSKMSFNIPLKYCSIVQKSTAIQECQDIWHWQQSVDIDTRHWQQECPLIFDSHSLKNK